MKTIHPLLTRSLTTLGLCALLAPAAAAEEDEVSPDATEARDGAEGPVEVIEVVGVRDQPYTVIEAHTATRTDADVFTVPNEPIAKAHYQLRTRFGSFGQAEAGADLGGPIAGGVRYRINGGYRHADSFRDFVTDDRDWVQPTLTWTPTEGTRVSVELSHSAQERTIDEGISFGFDEAPVAPIETFLGERGLPGQSYRHRMLFARVEQDLGDVFTLRSSFLGRSWSDDMYGIRRSRPVANEDNTVRRLFEDSDFAMHSYNWVTEGVIELDLGPTEHQILVGVDWRTRATDLEVKRGPTPDISLIDPVYGAPDPEAFSLTKIQQSMGWVSGFAQERATLFDDLHISVAGGFDSVTQDSENVDDPESRQDEEETALTGQAGILYVLPAFGDNRVAVFADYSQSFYPTAPGQLDRDGAQLDAETGVQYEGGLKFDLLDGALASTVAYVDLTKENIAIQDPEVEGAVQSAGRLGIHGVEVDVAGSPVAGLDLIASDTWADSEVLESDNLVGALDGLGQRAAGPAQRRETGRHRVLRVFPRLDPRLPRRPAQLGSHRSGGVLK